MTLKEIREIYERSSGRASEINRKLIFAGIAIVWLFHISDVSYDQTIPRQFLPILALFCYSMVADILQYITRAIIWHAYYYLHRVKDKKEEEVPTNEPEWYNALNNSFFYAKFIYTCLAYYYLASQLIGLVVPSVRVLDCGLPLWKFGYVCCVWGIIFCVIVIWFAIAPRLMLKKSKISGIIEKITHSEVWRWLIITILFLVMLMLFFTLSLPSKQEKLSSSQNNGIELLDETFMTQDKDTILAASLKTIVANQDSIIKLLQPKTVTKKKTKKQPLYLPLDTINCDGKEFVLVEKVK